MRKEKTILEKRAVFAARAVNFTICFWLRNKERGGIDPSDQIPRTSLVQLIIRGGTEVEKCGRRNEVGTSLDKKGSSLKADGAGRVAEISSLEGDLQIFLR